MNVTNATNVTTETYRDYDESFYALRVRIKFALMALIIPLGLISNSTAFCVFTRSTSLRKATTTHYLIALTFADSTYLVGELLSWLNTSDPVHGQFLLSFNTSSVFWCKTTYFMRYFGQFFSAWLTVAITVERCLCVCYPFKVGRLSTKLTTRVTIIVICVVSLLLNSYPYVYLTLKEILNTNTNVTYYVCGVQYPSQFHTWTWISFRVGSLIIPTVLVFLFTALILIQLRKLTRTRHEISALKQNSSDKNEKQIRIMLLLVAIAFVLLKLPYFILRLVQEVQRDAFYATYISGDVKRLWLAYEVAYCIAALNYSINFFLFYFSGSLFRQKLYNFLGCRKSSHTQASRMSRLTTKTTTSPSLKRSMYTSVSTGSPHQIRNVYT